METSHFVHIRGHLVSLGNPVDSSRNRSLYNHYRDSTWSSVNEDRSLATTTPDHLPPKQKVIKQT